MDKPVDNLVILEGNEEGLEGVSSKSLWAIAQTFAGL